MSSISRHHTGATAGEPRRPQMRALRDPEARFSAGTPVEWRPQEAVMRALVFFTISTMFSAAALAQQPAAQGPPPAARLFAGSADVTAMMAKAKSERKPDQP